MTALSKVHSVAYEPDAAMWEKSFRSLSLAH